MYFVATIYFFRKVKSKSEYLNIYIYNIQYKLLKNNTII